MHNENLKNNNHSIKKNILLQKCYDASFIHMKKSFELQYHILLLHSEFINQVSYSNKNYIIFKSDPEYIKKEKVKLLFNNLDEISISEINKYNFLVIVECSLKKDCVIFEEKLYKNKLNEVIDILITTNTNNHKVKHMIKKYLLSLVNAKKDIFILQKYLYLCSLYLDNDEILLKMPKLGFNTILGFYVNLYKRRNLNKEELISSLKKYSSQHKENIKIIIELIQKDVGSIAFYDTYFDIKQDKEVRIDLYNKKDNLNFSDTKSEFSHNDNPLMPNSHLEKTKEIVKNTFNNDTNSFVCKSEEFESSSFNVLEEQFNEFLKFEDLLVSKPFSEENNLILKNESNILDKQNTILIDHNFLKGVLKIENGRIYLIIDIIEKNTIIDYEYDKKAHKKIISKENKIELCTIDFECRELQLKIYDDIYNIKIGNYLEPYKISNDEWELNFSQIKKYKLVDYFDLNDTYVLDDEKFSFKFFNVPVYGKIFNDKIILKSSEQVLKEF